MNFTFLSLHSSLMVMCGGAIGAWLRMTVIQWFLTIMPGVPTGMVIVNLVGSFIIGFVYIPLSAMHLLWLKLLIIGGLLGALTTFSTFALDVLILLESKKAPLALAIAVAVPILSILSAFLGAALFKRFFV
ncbi:MAG TPA: fluoride efflux transporter CrcB [Gammaproteobacteria bacterium]|nr:fluoride efflux transporter CrcB [Gammaproteobacteria bacterium]MEC8011917.1 CrcB family protein [Pseudomonadota bacterium]HBF08828.1 fluoride efflux transporter CrcB [Gammaproteobacteria bacterium]HCK92082.1 fluoride efflux transporter CrcB [Gammaproteobacteria bacterium]|tara:strand:- start:46157 stop:46549 length:393 start_codon:yes stop_codon:yes gene_type:complete